MIYFKKETIDFFKKPIVFNKHTRKDILQYSIGANMYMPGTQKNITEKIINSSLGNLGAITLCCEDAIKESELELAENNILDILTKLSKEKNQESFPLIFIRVRNEVQFKEFSRKMKPEHFELICGFTFPKFNSKNGESFFLTISELSFKNNTILYGIPIIEDKSVIYSETRNNELVLIDSILKQFSHHVLNLRVGGTDFSSYYGLRREMHNTIYDVSVVAQCLTDILNHFSREDNNYVVSGVVWEYFSNDINSNEIKGLERELALDMQNGFFGKTIIHPTQIDVVNRSYIVPYSTYQDALNLINSEGGCFRNHDKNSMLETNPHRNWANKVLARAEVFGVFNEPPERTIF